MLQISAREANQHFSQYLQAAEQGEEIVITRHGVAIAKLTPVSHKKKLTKEQKAAWKRLKARLSEGFDLGIKHFDREELYDRHKG